MEKVSDFYCNAGQNANCYQIICKIVLVTKTPVKPCLEFSVFWKITSEKKDICFSFFTFYGCLQDRGEDDV